MAKLFYSLEEAADRLGKSEQEVKQMAESGQLQEFRDRDRLMFKVEQVNLLAGDHANEDTGTIPLADSGGLEGISLAESGSGIHMDSPKEQTGISIFDTEETEEADPAAATMVTSETPQFTGDPTASGSGLLDMTREADDTSLGADLLEDIYSGDTGGETVGESAVGAGDAGGALFEETGEAADAAGPVTIITAETIDSGWSGIAAGASVGVLLIVALALGTLITSMIGTYEGSIFSQAVDQIAGLPGGPAFATMYVGAGVVAIFAVIFGFIMKGMK
ncbi:MAG: hypothetical protein ACF8R7_17505 [Phycisphaerales bacterium JB039]